MLCARQRPRRAPGRLGLHRRESLPRPSGILRLRRPGSRNRDAPRQRRAHERSSLLRGPRPPRAQHARMPRRPRTGALRPGSRVDPCRVHGGRQRSPPRGTGDRRLQEQLGRQGQQLRLPRELPHRPGHAVREGRGPRHDPLRDPSGLHGGGQGRLRAPGTVPQRHRLPADAAGRLLRGGGRARDNPQAADHQHP